MRSARQIVDDCLRRQIKRAGLRAIVTRDPDNNVAIWATSRREAVKLIDVERRAGKACKL